MIEDFVTCVKKRTKSEKYVHLEVDEVEILVMYFLQGNDFWCQHDGSKYPGQFLIGVCVFPEILCKTGLESCQIGCNPCH